MELNEVYEKKDELMKKLVEAGIEEKEVVEYFEKELKESLNFKMEEKDAMVRALVSTNNYYRKYLDKLGNRIKFCALGITMVSDYGIGFKVKEIQRRLNNENTTKIDKEEMVRNGVIDKYYNVLYTPELTPITDKHGKVVNIDDELTQKMYGVVELEDKTVKPVVLSIFGKKACMEKKFLNQWSLVSADVKVKENGVSLTSRELLMKPITKERISNEEYLKIVNDLFKKDIVDVEKIKTGEEVIEEQGTRFFKNGAFLNFNFFSGTTSTELIAKSDLLEFKATIIADVKIPDVVDIDMDPKIEQEIWFLGNIRKVSENERYKIIVYGLFTNKPIDVSKFKIDEGLIEVNEVSTKNEEQRCDNNEDFYDELNR